MKSIGTLNQNCVSVSRKKTTPLLQHSFGDGSSPSKVSLVGQGKESKHCEGSEMKQSVKCKCFHLACQRPALYPTLDEDLKVRLCAVL